MAIKNFSWVYVGWVNLDNVGFEGTPVDDRYYSNEYLATPLYHLERMAKLMDGLGYDTLFTTEHHFQPEGVEVVPNILMACTHLAGMTKNLRFGCAANLLPIWNPIRLAEDYAMADIMTRGRVVFGIARGSQTREIEPFGAPMLDQEANRDLFEEQVEILMHAFHDDEFSHKGKHYTIPPAIPYRTRVLETLNIVPKPLYSKDIWQPITSARPRGLEHMAMHGIKGMFIPSFGHVDGEQSALAVAQDSLPQVFRDTAAKYGRHLEIGEDLAAYVYCHMGSSAEAAMKEVEPFEQEGFKRQAGIGGGPIDAMIKEMNWRNKNFKGYTLDQLQRLGDPRTAAAAAAEMGYKPLAERHEMDKAQHLFGTAEDIIATLKRMEELYPAMETVILHPPEATHTSIMMEQMERFAREVMPAFPGAIQTNRQWPDLYSDESKLEKFNPKYHGKLYRDADGNPVSGSVF